MRIQRVLTFVSGVARALVQSVVKAVVTSVVMGALVVALMHYMAVPVPSASDLIGGLSELAEVLS
jgi:uncharacterized oligopeptide transporter (OPT) family protein